MLSSTLVLLFTLKYKNFNDFLKVVNRHNISGQVIEKYKPKPL